MKYIRINNWEKSQRYKYRNNPWIRLYTDIIEKYDKDGQEKKFFRLKDLSRANFLCLLCLGNKFNNKIPYENNKELKHMTGLKKIYLEELLQCNYIVIQDDVSEIGAESVQGGVQDGERKKSKTCPTVTDTVTVTDTDRNSLANAGHFSKKTGDYFKDIEAIGKEIQGLNLRDKKKPFNVWQIIQQWANENINPGAIFETLEGAFKYLPDCDNPQGYLRAIMKTKSQNWREKGFIQVHKKEQNEWLELIRKLKEIK